MIREPLITGENDLATLRPDLLKYWDYDKNKKVKPTEIKINYSKKVWWKCDKGHEYQSIVSYKTKNPFQCPICYKESATLFKSKKVICVETGAVYNSMKEAANEMGSISSSLIYSACNNPDKLAYGYHWRYFYNNGDDSK
jgi:hypothetical protein